jgi:hypothetical protein
MRLSKLKGLTEEDGQDDQMKVWKFASEKFIQTVHKYTKQHLFWKKITIPEGEIHSSISVENIPFNPTAVESKYLGDIVCRIDYKPNMDPTPVIPLNLLQVVATDFMDSLEEINPDLFNKPSIYPYDILNMYHFRILNISIFPAQGILHLRDYMDTPTYNLKVLSPQKFGGIFLSRSHLLNVYQLVPGDLPTFADDYTSNMVKLVKKAKHVYEALKKGTWKGHTYELFAPHDWTKAFVIHQNKFDYNRTDKVLHPNFDITCNFGWEVVDGKKNSPEESPLSDEEQKEFRDYLKKRFKHFDIGY